MATLEENFMANTVLCSVDGEEWYPIVEISALCAINDYYASKGLDQILERYNSGEVITVDEIQYKKKKKNVLIL